MARDRGQPHKTRRRRGPPRPIYSRILDGNGRVIYEGYNRAVASRIWAGMVDDSKVLVAKTETGS